MYFDKENGLENEALQLTSRLVAKFGNLVRDKIRKHIFIDNVTD